MDLEKKLVLEHSELPAVEYSSPFRWRVATLSLLEMGKFRLECSLEAQQARVTSLGRVNEI
jgi:hypothetical protein